MRKLYLTYNEKDKKNESYSYSGDINPVYTTLSAPEIEAYMRTILASKIKSVRSINDKLLEVITNSGETIVIDNAKVFNDSNYPSSIELQERIKETIEKNNIAEYKKRLPENYNPRVNRKKKGKIKYMIEDNSIATNIILNSGLEQLRRTLLDTEMYSNEITRGR